MPCKRLMALREHEKIQRVVEKPFLVDVAMVIVVEALINGLDQAGDNLLKGFERTVDFCFGNRPVFGIYDDRAHGEASGSGGKGEPGKRSLFPPGSPPFRRFSHSPARSSGDGRSSR